MPGSGSAASAATMERRDASRWARSSSQVCLTVPAAENAVVNAVDSLVKNRLMMCEDADDQVHRLIDAGLAAGVPTPNGNEPKYPAVPHCN